MQKMHSTGHFVIVLSILKFKDVSKAKSCHMNSVFTTLQLIWQMCWHLPICVFTVLSKKKPHLNPVLQIAGFFFSFDMSIPLFQFDSVHRNRVKGNPACMCCQEFVCVDWLWRSSSFRALGFGEWLLTHPPIHFRMKTCPLNSAPTLAQSPPPRLPAASYIQYNNLEFSFPLLCPLYLCFFLPSFTMYAALSGGKNSLRSPLSQPRPTYPGNPAA